MRDEDDFTIPTGWRRLVHPRRGGFIEGELPPLSQSAQDLFDAAWAAQQPSMSELKAEPDLIAALRGPDTVLRAGILATLAGHYLPAESCEVILDRWITSSGPAYAALALSETAGLMISDKPQTRGAPRELVLRRLTDRADYSDHPYPDPVWMRLAKRLRQHLTLVSPDEYLAVTEALATCRSGLPRQRVVSSYLVPGRRDWFALDASLNTIGSATRRLLFHAADTADEFERFHPNRMDEFLTVVDVLNTAAAPLLTRWYGKQWGTDPHAQLACAEILGRIPTDQAFTALLDRIQGRHVGPALLVASELFPSRAARLLAERTDDWSVHLRERHLLGHRDLPAAAELVAARKPDAPAHEVPTLLRSPPWLRPRPVPVVVAEPLADTVMQWRDREQEQWALRWRPPNEDWAALLAQFVAGRLASWQASRFLLGAPDDVVRPLLPTWNGATADAHLGAFRPLVADYGLDALPAMLAFARAKPALGADLLLPYRNPEIAWMMADWLVRSRTIRPVAASWFDRHQAAGAALLIPRALSGKLPERRLATTALLRLDPAAVRAAGAGIGFAEQADALLATDPLDLVPAKVPTAPGWLKPELLPQVLLAESGHAIPDQQVAVLLSMIAISEPHQVYEGLTAVIRCCDPTSLASFGWALFRQWELAGRPATAAWTFDALGYLGDNAIVERLLPLIRRWPTVGGTARARRGVDALGGIGSDLALYELSRLARTAKSIPLRKHAAAELERAGLERGLLPEQLADRLVPGHDLPAGGARISYRGTDYTSFITADLELALRGSNGETLSTLPKPATPAERELAAEWRALRKKVKALLREQSRRLEAAMISGRTWTPAEMNAALLHHPLLSELARRLAWSTDGRIVILVESPTPTAAIVMGTDLTGQPVTVTGLLQIAHPIHFNALPWLARFAELAIVQPFSQLDRETHADSTPIDIVGRTVTTGSVIGLTSMGWQWAEREQAAIRRSLWRTIPSGFSVQLHIAPGSSAAANLEAEQTLTRLDVTATDGTPVGFDTLPVIVRSELLRDLSRLR